MNYAASYRDCIDPSVDAIYRTEQSIASHEEIARERASDFFDVADDEVLGFAVFETIVKDAIRAAVKSNDETEIGRVMRSALAKARAEYIDAEWERIAKYREKHNRWPTVWPQRA